MRFFLLRRLFPEIIALTAAAATAEEEIRKLREAHDDLVRQVGIQQAATQKQFEDIRRIIVANPQKAPLRQARSFKEVREFIGDDDAAA